MTTEAWGKYRVSAFTLLELMLTLALIVALSTLIMPSYRIVTEKADAVACIANLRTIGASFQSLLADNDNTIPYVEIDPDNPVYDAQKIELIGEEPKSLLETLQPYGVVEANLECPADVKTVNYHARYGSSYQYSPVVDGETAQAPLIYSRRGVFSVEPGRVTIMFDHSSVHPPPVKQNRLRLDGSVNKSRKWR